MLNLPIAELLPGCASLHVPGDAPAWEGPVEQGDKVGLLEGLTWQPRVVKLPPEAPIRHIVFAKAPGVSKERVWADPYLCLAKPARPSGAGLRYGGFWREQWLALLDALDQTEAPASLVSQLPHLAPLLNAADKALNLLAVALPSDKATCFEVSERCLPIPANLASNAGLRAAARHLLTVTTELNQVTGKVHSRPHEHGARRDLRLAMEAAGQQAFTDFIMEAAAGSLQDAAERYIQRLLASAAEGAAAWSNCAGPSLGRDNKSYFGGLLKKWHTKALNELREIMKQKEEENHVTTG
jgi:hypothetical protein